MLFGLTNAPSTFQTLMNKIFRGLLRKCVLIFFDNILVYDKKIEEHKLYLGQVLETLASYKHYANKEKCLFELVRVLRPHYTGSRV